MAKLEIQGRSGYVAEVASDGTLQTSGSGGGGGGAATIADGADVAQGTTTDASSANTVVGVLKAIKAAVTGTVAVSQAKSATATLSNVASSATSVTVLASNAARLGATVANDSTAILYVKFGSTASTTSFTVYMPGTGGGTPAYYEVPANYTGIITGIWASATGSARVMELTA